ncbi:ATP-binding cassette domain-containing protein [Spiroplasma apis]|uniref:ABC transporter ATP-binding protein/permease n=1 Tax=Spiroplasma apis B31 TaxID=1276258 RepID=V5RK17_SPIAP|nr:ABC transporter ATP-binding protein [Spiroplasma apis]AHB36456.1 ABC transporter ATP-binding protein/permease [Spiroplasma apis B31]
MKYFNKLNWLQYMSYTFSTLLGNVCYLAMSYSFSFIIDKAIENNFNSFLYWSGLSCFFIIMHLLLEYIGELILNSALTSLNTRLREIVAKNTFSDVYQLNLDSGEFINMNSNKISQIENNYFQSIFEITKCLLAIIVSFVLVIYISWIALMPILILSIIVTIIPFSMSKISQKAVNKTNEENDKFLQSSKDIFNSYWTYWTMNLSNKLIKDIKSNSLKLEKKNKRMKNIMSLSSFLNQLIIFLGQVILIIVFSYFYLKGFINSIGIITTLTTISATYVFFGNNSIRAFMKILSFKKVLKNDYKLINKTIVDNSRKNKEIDSINDLQKIKYENLNFKFQNDNKFTVNNFNLEINKGDKILIRGKSGIGKTTLLKLLFNPIAKNSGEVYINDKKMAEKEIRNFASYVNQESILNKGTLYSNLVIDDNYENRQEVLNYFNLLNMKDLISKLPNGLDSMVEDNFSNFSGGERQRISIIRSLLSNKSWFYLDEITSSLDEKTASIIFDIFLNDENKTIIMISHKVNSDILKKFNKIIDL